MCFVQDNRQNVTPTGWAIWRRKKRYKGLLIITSWSSITNNHSSMAKNSFIVVKWIRLNWWTQSVDKYTIKYANCYHKRNKIWILFHSLCAAHAIFKHCVDWFENFFFSLSLSLSLSPSSFPISSLSFSLSLSPFSISFFLSFSVVPSVDLSVYPSLYLSLIRVIVVAPSSKRR